jgi:hypothetical protein
VLLLLSLSLSPVSAGSLKQKKPGNTDTSSPVFSRNRVTVKNFCLGSERIHRNGFPAGRREASLKKSPNLID